jgi:hypothetical protein
MKSKNDSFRKRTTKRLNRFQFAPKNMMVKRIALWYQDLWELSIENQTT